MWGEDCRDFPLMMEVKKHPGYLGCITNDQQQHAKKEKLPFFATRIILL
jgi:hypothetical protein